MHPLRRPWFWLSGLATGLLLYFGTKAHLIESELEITAGACLLGLAWSVLAFLRRKNPGYIVLGIFWALILRLDWNFYGLSLRMRPQPSPDTVRIADVAVLLLPATLLLLAYEKKPPEKDRP